MAHRNASSTRSHARHGAQQASHVQERDAAREEGNFGGHRYEDREDGRFDPWGDQPSARWEGASGESRFERGPQGGSARYDTGYEGGPYGRTDRRELRGTSMREDDEGSRYRGAGASYYGREEDMGGWNPGMQRGGDDRFGGGYGGGGGRGYGPSGNYGGGNYASGSYGASGYGASDYGGSDHGARGGRGDSPSWGQNARGTAAGMRRYGGDGWRDDDWRDTYGGRQASSGYGNQSMTGSTAGEYGGPRWGGGNMTRQSQRARGPKGWTRSDERVKDDISERLYNDGRIDSSEVTIDVKDGKVTLQGTVEQRGMKHAIEDLVDGCPGVKDIDNRIRVASGGARESEGSTGSRSGEGGGRGRSSSAEGSGSGGGTSGSTEDASRDKH